MITLQDLEAAGAALSAGYVDHYDPAMQHHTRLALVTMGGDLVWEPGGEDYARRLVVDNVLATMDVPSSEIPTAVAGILTSMDAVADEPVPELVVEPAPLPEPLVTATVEDQPAT